jgi:hypothetical protein
MAFKSHYSNQDKGCRAVYEFIYPYPEKHFPKFCPLEIEKVVQDKHDKTI